MIREKVIVITLDGNIQRFSASALKVKSFRVSNDPGNDDVFVISQASSTAPGALDATNANFLLSGGGSQGRSPAFIQENDYFDLNTWFVKGTAGQYVRITYPEYV